MEQMPALSQQLDSYHLSRVTVTTLGRLLASFLEGNPDPILQSWNIQETFEKCSQNPCWPKLVSTSPTHTHTLTPATYAPVHIYLR